MQENYKLFVESTARHQVPHDSGYRQQCQGSPGPGPACNYCLLLWRTFQSRTQKLLLIMIVTFEQLIIGCIFAGEEIIKVHSAAVLQGWWRDLRV